MKPENNFLDEKLFSQFITPDCDRLRFILDFFNAASLKAYVMPIDGRNHIYVSFDKESYKSSARIKTILCHYDRVENTPGANDNSFAVFFLMNWAVETFKSGKIHNIRLIFTDGEELGSAKNNGKTILAQGSYSLAGIFKKLNITNDFVFAFDSMGRGTVPILAKPFVSEKTPQSFREKFFALQNAAFSILSASSQNARVLPLPYSDNAGFIANGIPAVAITMLPQDEVFLYENALLQNPWLEQFIMNKKIPENANLSDLKNCIPLTWRLFHTENDNLSSLTFAESAFTFQKILDTLSDFSFPFR